MRKQLSIISFIFIKILINLIGVIRAKSVAILGGVNQVGLLGQLLTFNNLQNNIVIFGSPATLIINIRDDEKYFVIRSILLIVLMSNIVYLSVILLLSKYISILLLKSEEFNYYILSWMLLGPIFSIYRFLESLNRAENQFKRIIKVEIIALIIAAAAVFPLIYFLGIIGVIVDLAVWYLIGIILFLPPYLKTLNIFNLNKKKSGISFSKLLKSCLNIFSRSVVLFISLLVFRIIVVQFLGIQKAGYFQSAWNISNYVNVMIQGFMFYLLPSISGTLKAPVLQQEINQNYRFIIYIILPIVVVFSVFPGFILKLLYSSEFTIMANYLQWMAFGKIFEAMFLFQLTILLGRNRLKIFLIMEIVRSVLLILLSWIFIRLYDLPGSIFAFLITQVISFFILFIIIQRNKILQLNRESVQMLFKTIIGIIILIQIPAGSFFTYPLRFLIGAILIIWTLDIKRYFELFNLFRQKSL